MKYRQVLHIYPIPYVQSLEALNSSTGCFLQIPIKSLAALASLSGSLQLGFLFLLRNQHKVHISDFCTLIDGENSFLTFINLQAQVQAYKEEKHLSMYIYIVFLLSGFHFLVSLSGNRPLRGIIGD